MTTEKELRQRYAILLLHLHERNRRLILGADARSGIVERQHKTR